MAIRKMKNSQVDLSGYASEFEKDKKAIEKAVAKTTVDLSGVKEKKDKILEKALAKARVDLSEIKTQEAKRTPRFKPLDLHEMKDIHEVNKIFEPKAKTAHRQLFEERLKRMEEKEIEVSPIIDKLASNIAKPMTKEINSQEEALKNQISELKEKLARLKKMDEIKKNLHANESEELEEEKEAIEKEEPAKKEDMIDVEPVETRKTVQKEVPLFAKKVKPQIKKLEFPEGFLWGTASSAYQVEGGIRNNWSQWERTQVMTKKFMKSGKKKKDFICGDAADSWNRYEEDFDLAKKLNNNAIRLGIEWARIQPQKDTWNVEAIKHYRKMLEAAKARDFTTVVTLWHWTLPTWFAADGGWEKEENIEQFLKYVELIIKEFGVYIDYWVTLNEPMMYVFGGYIKGYHPPGKHKPWLAERVFKNIIIVQKKVYQKIKNHFPKVPVGCANMLNYFEPADHWNPVEIGLAKLGHYYWNHRFLVKTKGYYDYIGVNYYFYDRIVWYPPFKKNKNKWVTDKGWEIFPKGIYEMLKYAGEFNLPILITENGLADAADRDRVRFIREHLRYVHQAIAEGVDVRGYFHWSLLDNFEWSYGWEPKFGLYSVDRETFKRTARPSAKVYAKIAKSNSVEVEI